MKRKFSEKESTAIRFLEIDLRTDVQEQYDPDMTVGEMEVLVANMDARINEADIPEDIRDTLLKKLYDPSLSDLDALTSTYEYLGNLLN